MGSGGVPRTGASRCGLSGGGQDREDGFRRATTQTHGSEPLLFQS